MDANRLPPVNSTPSPSEDEITKLRETVAQLSARVEALERQRAYPAVTPPLTHKGDSRLGLAIVNRVGALTLALGVIFFFKYASDNQWIGEQARVFIGLFGGLVMLGGAEWLRQRDRGESGLFTNGLAGCGLAVIYASAYASYGYYHLIIPAAAWLFLILISAFTVLLSMRHASPAIAALGFAGAILTALLLRDKTTPWPMLFAYLLLIALCVLGLALRQRWLIFLPVLTLLILFAAAFCFEEPHPAAFIAFSFLLAVLHFAAVPRAGNFAYLTGQGVFLLGAMRLVDLLVEQSAAPVNRFNITSAFESILLGVYGIAALTWGIARRSAVNRGLALVLLGVVILKLYLWDVWQLNTVYRVTAFVLLGVLLLGASYFYSRFRTRA